MTVSPSRASSEPVIALCVCKAVHPVARFAVQVRNGHDDDCVSFLSVYQAVGETLSSARRSPGISSAHESG
jgi:hypothetical protein